MASGVYSLICLRARTDITPIRSRSALFDIGIAGPIAGFVVACAVLAVSLGPFPDSDARAALATGFAGVAAMAVQNAVQRIHLGNLPPSTLMTGNTTQVVLDAVPDAGRRSRPGAPPSDGGRQRKRNKRNNCGVDMPRPGDLPYGQWMPDVEQYVLPRLPGRPQGQ